MWAGPARKVLEDKKWTLIVLPASVNGEGQISSFTKISEQLVTDNSIGQDGTILRESIHGGFLLNLSTHRVHMTGQFQTLSL